MAVKETSTTGNVSSLTFRYLCATIAVTVQNTTSARLWLDKITVSSPDVKLCGEVTLSDFTNYAVTYDATSIPEDDQAVTMMMTGTSVPGNSSKTVQIPVLPFTQKPMTITVVGHYDSEIGISTPNSQIQITYTRSTGAESNHSLARAQLGVLTIDDMYPNSARTSLSAPTFNNKYLFSVSANKKVVFSKGNLQYQASTGIWRFAEHQYEYVGRDGGNETESGRESQSAWIDLFGWGTSGHRPTAGATNTNYLPYATEQSGNLYGPAGYNTLIGDYRQSDWGYNSISNGGGHVDMWRTLTGDEWEYLLLTRPNAYYLRGYGRVGDNALQQYGLILLPDNWTQPQGMYFNCRSTTTGGNVYTEAQWASMEAAGAVFLPLAGYRGVEGNKYSVIFYDGSKRLGYYWSASPCNTGYTGTNSPDYRATCLYLETGVAIAPSGSEASTYPNRVFIYSDNKNIRQRRFGHSVRLVMDCPSTSGQ